MLLAAFNANYVIFLLDTFGFYLVQIISMDSDIKQKSVEELLRYIHTYLAESYQSSGFTLQFYKDQWRASIDGLADIRESYLKDALGWLVMHIKRQAKGDIMQYRK
jgi:hypothetical protein